MSKLEKKQIVSKLSALPSWQLIFEDSMYKLQKVFNFEDFEQALKFTIKVGNLSEKYDHHPRIVLEWGRVNITWWSHSEGGVVDSDFVMAKKVVATLQKKGGKDFTKAIKMIRSEKTGFYNFKEEIIPKDQLKTFFENK